MLNFQGSVLLTSFDTLTINMNFSGLKKIRLPRIYLSLIQLTLIRLNLNLDALRFRALLIIFCLFVLTLVVEMSPLILVTPTPQR